MPEILKHNKNVELAIAGEGPEEKNLKRLAKKLNVLVIFYGRVKHEKLSELYRKSNIFIMPSINEGMSNTVLEAMASGLPIITTRTGGTKELINGNGIIIEKQYPMDISNAVIELLKKNRIRETYGKKSRQLAMKLSWKNVAKEYFKLYKKATKKIINR